MRCDAMLQTTRCDGVRCQNSIASMQVDGDVGSPDHNHHGKGNAVEIPHLVHLIMPQLKVAEADNDESRLRPHNHWLLVTINERRLLLAFLRKSHPCIYVQRCAGMNRSFKMLVRELKLHVLRVENL